MPRKLYGLIGHPVKHSLSPAMQNAAFKELGINAGYGLYDVAPEDIVSFLDGIKDDKISGLNITIPHKIAVRDYLEKRGFRIDENARRLGAVNTIKVAEDGGLCGYNTDGPGFYRSLVEDLKFEPEDKKIFVLGAGGAARAVIMYLGNGPKTIFVFDTDDRKTKDLKDHYEKYYDKKSLAIIDRDDIKSAVGESALLVNATPVGMKESDPSPVDRAFLRPGLHVYDLVYNRLETRLVKDSILSRCHAITGLGMLLYQGAISFEIWTGRVAPVAVMRKALKAAIKKI